MTYPVRGRHPTGTSNQARGRTPLRIIEDEPAQTAETTDAIPSLEEVYRRHARMVATIALRVLGKPDEVDDIVHDTFLQVRRSLPRLRDPRALEGWLATITVRVTRRALHRARFRRMVGLGAIDADEVSSSPLSPDDYDYVHGAYARLSTLRTEERIAWVLRRVHGAQLDAVAQMCGCSLATAKRRISAADRKLEEVSR